jgi:hypothetical protein
MTGKRIASFIAALGLAAPASAAPITWSFEGQVVEIQGASPDTLFSLAAGALRRRAP